MAFMGMIRENMQYIAGFGAAILYGASVYPQVWGVQRYMKVVQLYKDGMPAPLDADCQKIGQEVLEKMKLDPYSEASIKFFTVYGQDMLSKGSTNTRSGAIVGIPVNFTYKSTAHVEKEKITLNNEHIDWGTPAGKSLLQSLIVSEKARKFAIARELMDVNSYHVQSRALLLTGCYSLAYVAGFIFNKTYNFPKRAPLPARLIVYSFFGSLGLTLYYLSLDKYNWYRDQKADARAAGLGKEFAEGGMEYYSKLLQRNVSLRALMKENGPKKYTVYGNEVHSWRSPHVPLTTRKDNLTALLNSYDVAENTSSSDSKNETLS